MLPKRLVPFCAAFALAACSTMPDTATPPFRDWAFAAFFEVGGDGRLEFPATNADLVVRSLRLTPAPLEERFDADGTRWFAYPPGAIVTVQSSLRAYAGARGDDAVRARLATARNVVQVTADTP